MDVFLNILKYEKKLRNKLLLLYLLSKHLRYTNKNNKKTYHKKLNYLRRRIDSETDKFFGGNIFQI